MIMRITYVKLCESTFIKVRSGILPYLSISFTYVLYFKVHARNSRRFMQRAARSFGTGCK
jgi:hypothetical protein